MNTNDTNRQKAHATDRPYFSRTCCPPTAWRSVPEQIQAQPPDAGRHAGRAASPCATPGPASARPTPIWRLPRPASAFRQLADRPPHHHLHLQHRACRTPCRRSTCRCCPATCWRTDRFVPSPLNAVIRKGKGHYVCDERLHRRLRQVNLAKERSGSRRQPSATLKETLDMDGVPHLSGYDRERVCVPQVCDCEQQGLPLSERFLETCDSGSISCSRSATIILLLADAIHRSRGKTTLSSRSTASSSWMKPISSRKPHGRCWA